MSHCDLFTSLSDRKILTSGGGLAGVDMADDDDVDMRLFFTIRIKNMSAMMIDIKLRLLDGKIE